MILANALQDMEQPLAIDLLPDAVYFLVITHMVADIYMMFMYLNQL